jgi:biopolymer transport protein ExbD
MLPEHTRSVKLVGQIDTSAFASVLIVLVFTVLFALWLTPPHHGYGPDLPRVSHAAWMPGALREDAMVITVIRDGSVYFGSSKVAPNELRSRIRRSLEDRNVERKVYVRADRRVHYSTVEDALDNVREVGIEKIAFLVH